MKVTFTCPQCGAHQYKVNDIGEYFCAVCHTYAPDSVTLEAAAEPRHPMVAMVDRLKKKLDELRAAKRVK